VFVRVCACALVRACVWHVGDVALSVQNQNSASGLDVTALSPAVSGEGGKLLVELGNLRHGLLNLAVVALGIWCPRVVSRHVAEAVVVVVVALARVPLARSSQRGHLFVIRVRCPDLVEFAINLVDTKLELEERETVNRLGSDVHDHGENVYCHAGNKAKLVEDPQRGVAAPDGKVEAERELQRGTDLFGLVRHELGEPEHDQADDVVPGEDEENTTHEKPHVASGRLKCVTKDAGSDGQPHEDCIRDLVRQVE
jgi:hypothetical protein